MSEEEREEITRIIGFPLHHKYSLSRMLVFRLYSIFFLIPISIPIS
jgi:hypothetical protein